MMRQSNIAEEARRSVNSALAILPRSLTASYALACMQVPHRVLSESDPFLFLVSEGRDPYKAAIKVATYWERRSNLFGDRVHLPMLMNQTDSSAAATTLTPQDMSRLRDFCLQLLPQDSLGRTVYVIDAARVPDFQNEADARCIFYQLQFAIGNILSATEGIVILLHLSQNTLWGNLDTLIQVMAKLIGTAMPFHLRRLHILSDQNPQVAPITTSAVVRQVLAKALSNECIVTIGASPQDFLTKLIPLGLDRQGLPSAFGGIQTIGPQASSAAGVARAPLLQEPQFSWTDQSAVLHGNSMYQHLLGGHSNVAGVVQMPNSAVRASVEETDDRKPSARTESELKKRPRVDSVHTANSSHDDDEESDQHGSGEDNVEESKEEKLRKRNALYSRRKYIRKKIEIEVLQEQQKKFSEDNQRLLREQQRLEGLLSQATECVDMYNRGDETGLAILTAKVAQQQQQQQQQQVPALSSNAATAAPLTADPTSRQSERQEQVGKFTSNVGKSAGGLGQVTAAPIAQGNLSPLEALALSAATVNPVTAAGGGQGHHPPILQGTNMEAMARAAVAAYTGGVRSIAELQAFTSMATNENRQQATADPPSFYDRLGQEAAGFFAASSPSSFMNNQAQLMAQRVQACHGNNLAQPSVQAGPARTTSNQTSPHDTKEKD